MLYDFEHYLKAGHGRAYIIAKEAPEKYRDAIMSACRKDYTFDIQCEGSRAFLTADLISLFEDPNPFIEAAKESFNSQDVDDVYNEIQYLSDLLIEFRQQKTVLNKYFALWEKIKKTSYSRLMDPSSHLLFNVEYLAIKLVGLASDSSWKIADNIVKDMGKWYLSQDESARDDFSWFYSTLEKQYGEDETREHLLRLAETSKEAKAFCDRDLKFEQEIIRKAVVKRNSLTASEVVEKLKAAPELKGLDLLHMGIRGIKDNEIVELAKAAVDTDSVVLRTQIVSVFDTKRFTWPLDPDYFMKWCDEGDPDLKHACHSAMSEITADCIRDYALNYLKKEFDAFCLMMLIKNYKPGDEELILSRLDNVPITDENNSEWHSIDSTILSSYKKLPVSILIWMYESTLCSWCRKNLIEDMIESGALTDEVRNECMWDANLDIRELVASC